MAYELTNSCMRSLTIKSPPVYGPLTREVSESIDRIKAEYGSPATKAEESVAEGVSWQETLFTVWGRDKTMRDGMWIYDLGGAREVCKPYEPVSPVFGEHGVVGSQSPVLSGAALEEYNEDRLRIGMPNAGVHAFQAWEERKEQEALAKAAEGYFAEAEHLVRREAVDRTKFKLMTGGRVEELKRLMHSDEGLVQSFAREISRMQEAMLSSNKPESFLPALKHMEVKLEGYHESMKTRAEKHAELLDELHAECDPRKGRIHARGAQARHALAEKELGRFLPWKFDTEGLGAFDEDKYQLRVSAESYEDFVNAAREKCLDYWLATQEIWRRAMCLLYSLRVKVVAGGGLEGEMKAMPAAFGRRVSDDMYRACLAMSGSLVKIRGSMVDATMTAGALRKEDFMFFDGEERRAEASLVPLRLLREEGKVEVNHVLSGLLQESERAMHLSTEMVKMLKKGLPCVELADWLLGALHGMMEHLAAYAKESCMEHEFETGVYGALGVEYVVKYWEDDMDEMEAEAEAAAAKAEAAAAKAEAAAAKAEAEAEAEAAAKAKAEAEAAAKAKAEAEAEAAAKAKAEAEAAAAAAAKAKAEAEAAASAEAKAKAAAEAEAKAAAAAAAAAVAETEAATGAAAGAAGETAAFAEALPCKRKDFSTV